MNKSSSLLVHPSSSSSLFDNEKISTFKKKKKKKIIFNKKNLQKDKSPKKFQGKISITNFQRKNLKIKNSMKKSSLQIFKISRKNLHISKEESPFFKGKLSNKQIFIKIFQNFKG